MQVLKATFLLLRGTGENEKAVVELQRALQLDPTRDEAYIEMALAYASLNKLDDAEKTYQKFIGINTNSTRLQRAGQLLSAAGAI